MNISETLKNKAVNGLIKEKEAVNIGIQADELLHRSVKVLKAVERNVGLDLGEEINSLVADITGAHFNAKQYLYNREPEGQE